MWHQTNLALSMFHSGLIKKNSFCLVISKQNIKKLSAQDNFNQKFSRYFVTRSIALCDFLSSINIEMCDFYNGQYVEMCKYLYTDSAEKCGGALC